MSLKVWVVTSIFCSTLCATPTLDFLTRYHSQANYLNTVDETVLYHTPFLSYFEGEVGGRAAVSKSNFESLDYKAEISYSVWKCLKLGTRFSHANQLSDTTAYTSLLFYGAFSIAPFRALRVFVTGGWYKRYLLLAKSTVLPVPFRNSSYSEHDFAGSFGIDLFPEETFFGTLKASTFDEISVFNLNNPYGEIQLGYRFSSTSRAILFSRYQLLLGFGRLDEFVFGFSLRFLA